MQVLRINQIFYCLLLISIAYVSNFIFASELSDPSAYIGWFQRSVYELNYFDFGFIKRGLIGTIFKLNYEKIDILIKITSITLVIFSILIYSKIVFVQKNDQIKKYLLLLGISPFFFSNIGLDLGRLDHYGTLFFLTYILFFINKKKTHFFIISAPFLIFITEIHFFTVSIFIIYIELFFRKLNYLLIINILLTIIIIFCILFFGSMDDELIKIYSDIYYAVDIYFQRGQINTSIYFWKLILDFKATAIYRHLISIIIFLIICYFYFNKIDKSLKSFILICIYFSTFLIGIDHARFLSTFIFNLTFILLIFINKEEKFMLPKFRNIYIAIFLLGPWGINKALPILTIIKKIVLGQIIF